MKPIIYSVTVLLLLLLDLAFAFGQQVNPTSQIRWGVGPHCGTAGYTWSPAANDCIAAGGAAYGFQNQLSASLTSSATTMNLNTPVSGYPSSGTVIIDSEWITFNGINTGTNQLLNLTRGVCMTTAAAHNNTETVYSVDLSFSPCSQQSFGGVFGFPNIGAGQTQLLMNNCNSPVNYFNDAGSLAVLQLNCGSSAFIVDSAGRIHQTGLQNIANFMSPIYIGTNYQDTASNIGQPIPILDTTNVAQTTGAAQFALPIGTTSGINGPVTSVAVPNIPAPTLNGQTGGSCSITYEIAGVTSDGATVPGATATVTSLSFPSAGIVYIQTPQVAGIVTYNAYRTVVSGCGSMTIGKFAPAQTSQYPLFIDTGLAGDGTSPPSTNTSIGKLCVNGFCETAGPSATENFTCSTSTRGWLYHNTLATTSPFTYVCNGTSFVTAF